MFGAPVGQPAFGTPSLFPSFGGTSGGEFMMLDTRSQKKVEEEEEEKKRLISERNAMQLEKEKLEREAKERDAALEKERKEKEELAERVAQLELLLKTSSSLEQTPPPTPPPESSAAASAPTGSSPPPFPPVFVFSASTLSEGVANRDEALKALNIAKKAFADGDLAKAERFALKAQAMHKCPEVADLLEKITASKPSLEDRVAKLEVMGDAALKRLIKLERLYAHDAQDLKDSILDDVQGKVNPQRGQNPNPHKTPRRVMKLYDRLDNDSSALLQWLFNAVLNSTGEQQSNVFGAAQHQPAAAFMDRLRQNPFLAGSMRSILADYIKDHTETVIFQDSQDQQVFNSMNPCNGQGSGAIQIRRQESTGPFQQFGPFKARFMPKDPWFIRFIEKLRDASRLEDPSSPLGLYNKVIQVDTFTAQVRLYFKSA